MLFFIILSCTQNRAEKTDTQEPVPEPTQEDTAEELEDTAPDGIECPPLDCSVEWTQEHVALSFSTFEEQGSYFFGMAQTGLANPNIWTGEDCHMGFSTEQETFSYCHPARDGITLQYGAPFDEVLEGFSTHFASAQFEEDITYIIKESISECCWVWGNTPEYYQELGCTLLVE